MPAKIERPARKGYSLEEIKAKYLPNRKDKLPDETDVLLTRETFLDMLKQVSRTATLQRDITTPKTSR